MRNETRTYATPALGCLVGTAYQTMVRQLSAELKKAGLDISASEYLVLRSLYYKDGSQQCEIAEMVGKDKASVCRSVAGLEKKELVTTESVSYKCLRVYLTGKAREIGPRIMAVAESRHRALTELATADEIEAFTKVLRRIAETK